MSELTREYLLWSLDYEPMTGIFIWLNPPRNHSEKKGRVAGHTSQAGYVKIKLNGRHYPAHRLAWFYVYGWWPAMIDHMNGDRADNRIVNLKPCTNTENTQNHTRTHGKSGLPVGVRRTNGGQYQARITSNKTVHHLGVFRTKEEAKLAYDKKRKEVHYAPVIS